MSHTVFDLCRIYEYETICKEEELSTHIEYMNIKYVIYYKRSNEDKKSLILL